MPRMYLQIWLENDYHNRIYEVCWSQKWLKRAKKVDMIADGISLAEAKKGFYRM